MKTLINAGASIIGGCCGTTVEHMRQLVLETKDSLPIIQKPNKVRNLTSERMTVSFSLNDNFIIVGERINPTGKKKLQAEIKIGKMDMVSDFAEQQEKDGARILDINMGMGGIDEKAMIMAAIEAAHSVSNLPLAIDSSHVDIIEYALRRYPGRALINSISLESGKCDALLKLAKKYGAMFILLPLSDKGLPKDINEKIEIINEIKERAYRLDLCDEDIIVDGLVTTVGANKIAAIETLETIRYCRANNLATLCGLSNISFGLPERSFINAAFLTMAIQAGLTMAIANPSQDLLVLSTLASDLLLNKEEADLKYIEAANAFMEKKEEEKQQQIKLLASHTPIKNSDQLDNITLNSINTNSRDLPSTELDAKNQNSIEANPELTIIREAVLKGRKSQITILTKQALDAGMEPNKILDLSLLPAINEVGDLFDRGKYFLPQLIASAETMRISIEILEPLLTVNKDQILPTVVIATVEGDIHDIGKNLVALMLKNYGFRVIDLGKDVSKEKIIEAAMEHNASIIALSALMTTTMQQMKKVIDYGRSVGTNAKVIVGGAVITQDYADEIGADGYSKDAADAVRLAKRLMNITT